jgi:hypothetical protein
MNLSLHRASYSKKPIHSMRSLAAALNTTEENLVELAREADLLYRPVQLKNSNRQVFDAKPPLKAVHRKIKSSILDHVRFPPYITGSVRGKDYKENAKRHAGQQIVICEDVKGFFPSVTRHMVYDIWREFFKFGPAVAEVLTSLTTRDGTLPQGAIPSSYLANLVFWRREPALEASFRSRGISYSRYVDDIGMSSAEHLSTEAQSWLIAQVYGMLKSAGVRAGRGKHEIYPASDQMFVTKLMVNEKPGFIQSKRANIRAGVFQAERDIQAGRVSAETIPALNKLAQRVGQLGRFHATEAEALRIRVRAARSAAEALLGAVNSTPPREAINGLTTNSFPPPWE